MKALFIILMIFEFFGGEQTTEPDWDKVAANAIPSSPTEIIAAMREHDRWFMDGEDTKVLKNPKDRYGLHPYLDSREYSYSNLYEYNMAWNKYYKEYRYPAFNEDMADELIPIINIGVSIGLFAKTSRLSCYQKGTITYLWHPQGAFVQWYYMPKKKPINRHDLKFSDIGRVVRNSATVKFVNRFIEYPYLINIKICPPLGELQDATHNLCNDDFTYIGIVKNKKLIIHDIQGNVYNGIEDLIIKKYGSIDDFIKWSKKVKANIRYTN